MNYLRRLGNVMSIPIPKDEDGFIGRECPAPDCEGYFKIQLGTGLKGSDLPCHCPYCGHIDRHNKFYTREQIEYAKSVVVREVTEALHKDLKALEFDHPPRGPFGIGMSLKVEDRPPHPIHHYREKQLETEVVCDECTLRYAIYGVFAFCPDCGIHNSRQILDKNLELAEKELALAANAEKELANYLISDALENAVSSFDGFGRELCRINSAKSSSPKMAENLSFQNLAGAQQRLVQFFGIDLASGVGPNEWDFACRCFQKRHLLAHKMGVIDQAYIDATQDPPAVVGRKITIERDEVVALIGVLRKLGTYLFHSL